MKESLLDLYSDYLICSFGPTTATGLAALLEQQVSHDKITRLLASEAKTSRHLWHLAKPLVRDIESEDGLLILDDSIEEKPYTDENDIVCWHCDHAKNQHVKGINFLSALYAVGDTALPVAFELVTKTETFLDPKTQKPKRRSQISKNALYRMLLQLCYHNQVKFKYVLNDAWFASADNMKFIKLNLKKEFVMPIKCNRKVALSSDDKKQGRYHGAEQLDLPEGTTRKIYLESVEFALLLTKEVFTNGDGSTGVLYLVSSDLTLEGEQIQALYKKRWSVEVYHKSLKQNASLEKSPTRTETTQRNHFFASLCAYVKLEGLKSRTQLNHFALKTKIYISALKSAYAELVKLKPQPLAA